MKYHFPYTGLRKDYCNVAGWTICLSIYHCAVTDHHSPIPRIFPLRRAESSKESLGRDIKHGATAMFNTVVLLRLTYMVSTKDALSFYYEWLSNQPLVCEIKIHGQ